MKKQIFSKGQIPFLIKIGFALFIFKISIACSLFGQIPECIDYSIANGNFPPGCLLCKDSHVRYTAGFSNQPTNLNSLCGGNNATFFVSILPDSTGVLEVELTTPNCTSFGGLQMILLDKNLKPLTNCIELDSISDKKRFRLEKLNPFERYNLMVAYGNRTECFVKISVLQGTERGYLRNGAPEITVESPNISDTLLFCSNRWVRVSIPPQEDDISDFEWAVSSTTFHRNTDSPWAKEFSFRSNGKKKVTITGKGFCNSGFKSVLEIDVLKSPTFHSQSYHVCKDKFPVKLDDNIFMDFGDSAVIYPMNTCDSISNYYILQDFPFVQNPVQIRCFENPVTYGGFTFDSTGLYQITFPHLDTNKCDSIINLDLTVVEKKAPEVSCAWDSFLGAYALGWSTTELSEGNIILVNDDTVAVQNFIGHLYFPFDSSETFEVKIQPYNSTGCIFPPGIIQCNLSGEIASVKNKVKNNITVHPNPSNGIFNIFSKSSLLDIEVLDFSGKPIFFNSNFQKNEIDLSGKPSGIYFFKIKTKEGVFVKKAILL